MKLLAQLFISFIFSILLTDVLQADTTNKLSCKFKETTIINFPLQKMPFQDGTIITNQFKNSGLIFSSDDPSDNRIQDGISA